MALTKDDEDFIKRLRMQDLDMNGRKIINVGQGSDVITRDELEDEIRRILQELGVL